VPQAWSLEGGAHAGGGELIIAIGLAMAWPIAANGQPDVRALRSQISPHAGLRAIADKLAQFVKEIQNQVAWTTQLPIDGRLH